jgi:hypothetical protein
MKKHHWIGAFIVLAIGYAIGAMYPGVFNKLKAKASGGAAA